MDKNINLTILNEIGKATRMGLSSITFVSEKVKDETMKQNLSTQYAEYSIYREEKHNTLYNRQKVPLRFASMVCLREICNLIFLLFHKQISDIPHLNYQFSLVLIISL